MKKDTAIIAIIGAAVLAFVAGTMINKPAKKAGDAAAAAQPVQAQQTAQAAAAPAFAGNPSMGPADAKVTIIEISDFQCPFCSRAKATLDELHKEYPNDLRIVFVNQPLSFHNQARPAAIASFAAHKQGKFWEMYDKLFSNAKELGDDNYKKWAKEIGLDMARFESDLKDADVAKAVDRDQAVANALGVSGTPGFFVNGVSLSGAQPKEEFKKIIDEQIKKANDELGKGTPMAEINEKLTRANNPSVGSQIIGLVFKGEEPPKSAAAAPPAPKREKPGDDPNVVWKVELHGDEPIKGNADALVTLVEFTDFQCPFCSKVRASLEEVKKNYAPDKVRLVFKNQPLPFHSNAMIAAEAALCAGDQGKFWEMEERLFSNQGALGADELPGHAKEVGLNLDKFNKCLADHKFKPQILKDQATAEKITATGTPAFFVNGRKLGGNRPFEDFKKLIDEEMGKAEAKVASGVARKEIYAKTIGDGKEFIPPPPLEAKVADFDYRGSPTLGPKDAKVKIVEFKDFECPFCAKIIPALKQVQKDNASKVSIVFKHFPLSNQCNPKMSREMHPGACLAAYWSMAAEAQGKFWEFEDIVFQNYQSMMPREGELPARLAAQTENLKRWCKEIGMDIAKAEAFVASKAYEDRLKKDMNEAVDAGVNGTPAVYINGRKYNGGMNADRLNKIIGQVLEGKL
ncbi:MAG: thioredoxin domain-containing protein [Deltaproteobacteria bacterium]|nr:thioredoxin domain-containing protein [Deltaproteobacteria bacterium]